MPVVVHLDVNAGLEDLPDYRGQQKAQIRDTPPERDAG